MERVPWGGSREVGALGISFGVSTCADPMGSWASHAGLPVGQVPSGWGPHMRHLDSVRKRDGKVASSKPTLKHAANVDEHLAKRSPS